MSGTVLAVSCRALIAYADARNQPTGQWLESAGLTTEQLQDPDARLDPATIFRLWRQAYQDSGDPALALHVAELLPRGAYRAIEYLAAHAPTVGQAYSKIADYFSVIHSNTELAIDIETDQVKFGPRTVSTDPSSYPAIEYMLTACHLRVRDMTGIAHRPIAIDFAAPPQPHTEEIERVFGCAVHWNADRHRLRFTLDDWNQPTAQPDPALLMVLEDHARILKERHPSSSSLLQILDQFLERAWEAGEPTLDATARRLGMSSRSLQRRLREEGSAFSERIDDARRRATLRWLQCTEASLAEVAYLVGFKEQASLTRAVQRWTGQTPRRLRRSDRHGPR
ncbi:MAG TPA: AraC family transcriptional regulator [Polyangiaceae bacterium]|nr:AraC family transcriptional regulator [Polyangiaceae bacterium]